MGLQDRSLPVSSLACEFLLRFYYPERIDIDTWQYIISILVSKWRHQDGDGMSVYSLLLFCLILSFADS